MTYADQYELELILRNLLSGPDFNLQVGTATDEILAILAAQAAKTPIAPPVIDPPPPPLPPVPPPPPPSVLPKNPIQQANQAINNVLNNVAAAAGNLVQRLGQTGLGQGVVNVVQNVGQGIRSAGQAIGQGAAAVGQTVGRAASTVGQAVGNAAAAAGRAVRNLFRRSDIRLKTDIQLVGQSPSGINIYEFRFTADPTRKFQGVIAQELIGTAVESAVYTDAEGYYVVDYAMIDVKFIEVTEA